MLSFKTLLGYSISACKKYFLDASCKFRLNSKDEILISSALIARKCDLFSHSVLQCDTGCKQN
nr:hypothetical protein [uncultured Campylobacter sp.]